MWERQMHQNLVLNKCPLGCIFILKMEKHENPKNKVQNDPSAGSPTETLLRLLLPLSDKVWPSLGQMVCKTQSD